MLEAAVHLLDLPMAIVRLKEFTADSRLLGLFCLVSRRDFNDVL